MRMLDEVRTRLDSDEDIVEILQRSRTFSRLAAVLSIVERAAETSAFVASVRSARSQWTEASPTDRLRALGVMLLIASAVHIVVNSAFGDTAGRFWLAIPAVSGISGVVLLLVATRRNTAPAH